MNDVQLFLEEMYKNVSKEEMKKIDENISRTLLKKIYIMIDNQIISKDDAIEFAGRHKLDINKPNDLYDKKKTKKSVESVSDPCGGDISINRSSC
jgi:predicted transport protein